MGKYSQTYKHQMLPFYHSETTKRPKFVIPPLCMKIFDTRKFQKDQRDPSETFSGTATQKYVQKS